MNFIKALVFFCLIHCQPEKNNNDATVKAGAELSDSAKNLVEVAGAMIRKNQHASWLLTLAENYGVQVAFANATSSQILAEAQMLIQKEGTAEKALNYINSAETIDLPIWGKIVDLAVLADTETPNIGQFLDDIEAIEWTTIDAAVGHSVKLDLDDGYVPLQNVLLSPKLEKGYLSPKIVFSDGLAHTETGNITVQALEDLAANKITFVPGLESRAANNKNFLAAINGYITCLKIGIDCLEQAKSFVNSDIFTNWERLDKSSWNSSIVENYRLYLVDNPLTQRGMPESDLMKLKNFIQSFTSRPDATGKLQSVIYQSTLDSHEVLHSTDEGLLELTNLLEASIKHANDIAEEASKRTRLGRVGVQIDSHEIEQIFGVWQAALDLSRAEHAQLFSRVKDFPWTNIDGFGYKLPMLDRIFLENPRAFFDGINSSEAAVRESAMKILTDSCEKMNSQKLLHHISREILQDLHLLEALKPLGNLDIHKALVSMIHDNETAVRVFDILDNYWKVNISKLVDSQARGALSISSEGREHIYQLGIQDPYSMRIIESSYPDAYYAIVKDATRPGMSRSRIIEIADSFDFYDDPKAQNIIMEWWRSATAEEQINQSYHFAKILDADIEGFKARVLPELPDISKFYGLFDSGAITLNTKGEIVSSKFPTIAESLEKARKIRLFSSPNTLLDMPAQDFADIASKVGELTQDDLLRLETLVYSNNFGDDIPFRKFGVFSATNQSFGVEDQLSTMENIYRYVWRNQPDLQTQFSNADDFIRARFDFFQWKADQTIDLSTLKNLKFNGTTDDFRQQIQLLENGKVAEAFDGMFSSLEKYNDSWFQTLTSKATRNELIQTEATIYQEFLSALGHAKKTAILPQDVLKKVNSEVGAAYNWKNKATSQLIYFARIFCANQTEFDTLVKEATSLDKTPLAIHQVNKANRIFSPIDEIAKVLANRSDDIAKALKESGGEMNENLVDLLIRACNKVPITRL